MNAIHFFDWGVSKRFPYELYMTSGFTNGFSYRSHINIDRSPCFSKLVSKNIIDKGIIFRFKVDPDVEENKPQPGYPANKIIKYIPNKFLVTFSVNEDAEETKRRLKEFKSKSFNIYINNQVCNISKISEYVDDATAIIESNGSRDIMRDEILEIKIQFK